MVAFDDSRLTQSGRRRKSSSVGSGTLQKQTTSFIERETKSRGGQRAAETENNSHFTVAALFSSIWPSAPHWAFMRISCSSRRANTLLDGSNEVQKHDGEIHQAPSMSVLHTRSTDTCAQHWYSQICPMMLWVSDQVQSFSNTRSKTR